MSTTSEPGAPWRGDVRAGVDAWTRGAEDGAGTVVEEGALAPVTRPRRRRTQPDRWRRHDAVPVDEQAAGPEADPESVARTILLDQLTGRARSRHELADKLAARGVPDEIAETLLDRFTEVGLIDDEAFARAWIDGRQSAKGLAKRALAQELRRKGIADEVAREALDKVDPGAEEESARLLVRKKLRSLSRVDDTTATRRLVAMLARKGYGSGMAYAVVRDELAHAGRDDVLPDAEE